MMRDDADERMSILSSLPVPDEEPQFTTPQPTSLDPSASKWLDTVMADQVGRSGNTGSSYQEVEPTDDRGSLLSFVV